MPHTAELSPLPRERGWAKEQPQGPLLLSPPCTFQDKSLVCKGSPATHTPDPVTAAAAGQTGQAAPTPALWPEPLAAPDPTCNLHQLISSSLCLKSLNQEKSIFLLQSCAGSVPDHTQLTRTGALAKGFDAHQHKQSWGFSPSQQAHHASKEHH